MAWFYNVYPIASQAGEQPKLITILEKDSVADAYSHAVAYYGSRHGNLYVKAVRSRHIEAAKEYIVNRKRRKKGS